MNKRRRYIQNISKGDRDMSNNEFGGTLYPTQRAMLDAIAEWDITADGKNSPGGVRGFFSEVTDGQLAADAIASMDLDKEGLAIFSAEDTRSHMEREGYTAADLAEAYGRIRARLEDFLSEAYGEDA